MSEIIIFFFLKKNRKALTEAHEQNMIRDIERVKAFSLLKESKIKCITY